MISSRNLSHMTHIHRCLRHIIPGLALLAASTTLQAQQLPNSSFEDEWVDCIPWTSEGNTNKVETEPANWKLSNVYAKVVITITANTGKQIDGVSGKGIGIFNTSQSGNDIPGYLTLGTPWSTAAIKGTSPSKKDGGSWGGISFSNRPDAMRFSYKRSNASGSSQKATVLFYSWKGSWSQADVPGCMAYNMFSNPSPKKCTMENRDRNILGITTSQGGAITASTDAELIATAEHYITQTASEWTDFVLPITYKSEATPSMVNVIFGATDYFDDSNIHSGDEFDLDEVKLMYYSRLKSLSVNGVAVSGFDSQKYAYFIPTAMPSDKSALSYTFCGESGMQQAEVTFNASNATASIKVTNTNTGSDEMPDVDGLTEHTYVLQFLPLAATATVKVNGVAQSSIPVSITVDENNRPVITGLTINSVNLDPITLDGSLTFANGSYNLAGQSSNVISLSDNTTLQSLSFTGKGTLGEALALSGSAVTAQTTTIGNLWQHDQATDAKAQSVKLIIRRIGEVITLAIEGLKVGNTSLGTVTLASDDGLEISTADDGSATVHAAVENIECSDGITLHYFDIDGTLTAGNVDLTVETEALNYELEGTITSQEPETKTPDNPDNPDNPDDPSDQVTYPSYLTFTSDGSSSTSHVDVTVTPSHSDDGTCRITFKGLDLMALVNNGILTVSESDNTLTIDGVSLGTNTAGETTYYADVTADNIIENTTGVTLTHVMLSGRSDSKGAMVLTMNLSTGTSGVGCDITTTDPTQIPDTPEKPEPLTFTTLYTKLSVNGDAATDINGVTAGIERATVNATTATLTITGLRISGRSVSPIALTVNLTPHEQGTLLMGTASGITYGTNKKINLVNVVGMLSADNNLEMDMTINCVPNDNAVTATVAMTTVAPIIPDPEPVTATHDISGYTLISVADTHSLYSSEVTINTTDGAITSLVISGILNADVQQPITFDNLLVSSGANNTVLLTGICAAAGSMSDIILSGSVSTDFTKMTMSLRFVTPEGDATGEFTVGYPDGTMPTTYNVYTTTNVGDNRQDGTARLILTTVDDTHSNLTLSGWTFAAGNSNVDPGSITLHGVERTTAADGSIRLTTFATDLTSSKGQHIEAATLSGNIDAQGRADITLVTSLPVNGVRQVATSRMTTDDPNASTQDPGNDDPGTEDPGTETKGSWTYDGGEYPGILVVELDGEDLTEGGSQSKVIVTMKSNSKCDFLLPDLSLGEVGTIGDIALADVDVTIGSDGTVKFDNVTPGYELLGGEIVADVTLKGTVATTGVASMKIDVVWNSLPIACTFNGNGAAARWDDNSQGTAPGKPDDNDPEEPEENINYLRHDTYTGTMSSYLGDDFYGDNTEAEVVFSHADDGTCDFRIPDLTIEGIGSLGEIRVRNVLSNIQTQAVEDESSLMHVRGTATNTKIADKSITADISVSGKMDTESRAGNLSIDIVCHQGEDGETIPIHLDFTSTASPTSIGEITTDSADDNTEEWYTIGGIRVNPQHVTTGYYIVRRGNQTSKVYIK